jgi:hypothetical protein
MATQQLYNMNVKRYSITSDFSYFSQNLELKLKSCIKHSIQYAIFVYSVSSLKDMQNRHNF